MLKGTPVIRRMLDRGALKIEKKDGKAPRNNYPITGTGLISSATPNVL